jgi:hypothetical protein
MDRLVTWGKGKGDRWNDHERRPDSRARNYMLRAIVERAKKLGKELPKVKLREKMTEDEAFELERIFIKAIGRKKDGGPLVNLTDGGDGSTGLVFRPESRKLLSVAHTGKTLSADHKKNISIALKDKPKSPEHAANAAAAQRGKKKKSGWWTTEEGRAKQRANNPGHTGHHHSEAAILLIKAARARQTARDRERKRTAPPL